MSRSDVEAAMALTVEFLLLHLARRRHRKGLNDAHVGDLTGIVRFAKTGWLAHQGSNPDLMIKSQPDAALIQRAFRHVHVSSSNKITMEFSSVGMQERRERVIESNCTVGGSRRESATPCPTRRKSAIFPPIVRLESRDAVLVVPASRRANRSATPRRKELAHWLD